MYVANVIRTIWFRLLPSSVVFIQPHIAEQHPPIALLLHFPSPEQQTLVAHDTADWLQSNSLPRPPLEIICTDVFLTFQPDEDWIVAHLYLNAFFLYITCLGYGNNAHQTSCFVQNRLSWNVIVLWEDFSSQTRFSIKACNTSKNKRKKKQQKHLITTNAILMIFFGTRGKFVRQLNSSLKCTTLGSTAT